MQLALPKKKFTSTAIALPLFFLSSLAPELTAPPRFVLPVIIPTLPTNDLDLHSQFPLDTLEISPTGLMFVLAAPSFTSPSAILEPTSASSVPDVSQRAVLVVPTPQPRPIAVPPTLEPVSTPPQPVTAPEHLEPVYQTYAVAYNVNPDLLKSIANCESHHNPGAANGPYGGMYQFHASTWVSTRNAMGLNPDPDLRFDAEESIKTAAFKINAGGVNAWANCVRAFAN